MLFSFIVSFTMFPSLVQHHVIVSLLLSFIVSNRSTWEGTRRMQDFDLSKSLSVFNCETVFIPGQARGETKVGAAHFFDVFTNTFDILSSDVLHFVVVSLLFT